MDRTLLIIIIAFVVLVIETIGAIMLKSYLDKRKEKNDQDKSV